MDSSPDDATSRETERTVRRWWEETASYFQAEGDLSVGVHWGPGVPESDLDVLPAVQGLCVLELGCGGGQFGLGLLERGADRVVGLDLSRSQLTHASTLATEQEAELSLIEGSVTALPFGDDSVDLAVSAYAFQWVPDFEMVVEETARVLSPGGHFVFSIPHPFYQVFTPESRTLAHSYHDPGPIRRQEDGIDADQVLQRRRLSDIHAILRDAGFEVEQLIEPGVSDPERYTDRWSSKPELMAMVPRTLIVKASHNEADRSR